jgi:hypothetical protein
LYLSTFCFTHPEGCDQLLHTLCHEVTTEAATSERFLYEHSRMHLRTSTSYRLAKTKPSNALRDHFFTLSRRFSYSGFELALALFLFRFTIVASESFLQFLNSVRYAATPKVPTDIWNSPLSWCFLCSHPLYFCPSFCQRISVNLELETPTEVTLHPCFLPFLKDISRNPSFDILLLSFELQ